MPSSHILALCFGVFLVSLCNTAAVSRPTDDPPLRFVKKQFKVISGKKMAYVEAGTGDPIVFLHGNPTSSYLWRNVMPHLEGHGRLIAPDLIGMGDSDKLDLSGPNRYTFLEHSNFLYQLLEALGVKENVTFVIHDWGSALGFLWAYYNRFNPNAVKAIVFAEAIVAPLSRKEFPPEVQDFFSLLQSSPTGEELILEQNFFVEVGLPSGIIRNLTEKEFGEYRRPYLKPGEDRRPTLTWSRQLPIDGEPADVDKIVSTYSKWLGTTKIPKLFIKAEPGALITDGSRFLKIVRSWPEVTEVSMKGNHYLQEDSPNEMGMAISEWLTQEEKEMDMTKRPKRCAAVLALKLASKSKGIS